MKKKTDHIPWHKFLTKVLSILVITISFFVNTPFLGIDNAWAHRPHDVTIQIRLSPNYQQNQTLFIIVRHNLFKSIDGGVSWQRIVNGLDNRGLINNLAGNQKNDQVMYLSTNFDGIYKSEDGGNSWFKVNNGLNHLAINNLKVSPQSENVVLAAAGENHLYQTEDGGNNWQEIFTAETEITSLLVAENRDKILVGDADGNLYVSVDKGSNWQQLDFLKQENSGEIRAIATSPNSSNLDSFWVGTGKKGVWQTNNNGQSFTAINNDLSDQNVTDLLVDASNNLYASTWDEGFFISQDQGKSWVKQSQGLEKDKQADQLKLPHFSYLAMYGDTIFLGGFDGLFKSVDLGKNWQSLETLSLGTVMSLDISPNYLNDQTLAIVTYVGNFYLSQDGGTTWTALNKGLEIPRLNNAFDKEGQHPRRFFDVAFSSNYGEDNTIFSSLLWSKLLTSTNQGQSWQIVQLPREVRGVHIVVSPSFSSDKTVYVANQVGYVFKSVDGGKSFSTVGKTESVFGNDTPSMVISPNFAEDKTLYASTKKGIYKTIDGGKTWASVTFGTKLDKKYNLQLAISPNYKQDQTLMVGTHEGVFKTEDAGQTWENLTIAELDQNPYIEGVAISPDYQNDQTVIITVKGKGLYKSTDGGQSFVAIGDRSLPVSRMGEVPSAGIPIQFSPGYATDNTLYSFGSATTEVFKSTDGGNTWETLAVPINPVSENEQYDAMTNLSLWFYVYRPQILRLLAAVLVGLFTYFLVGFLRLEKKIPLSKLQIKMVSSVVLFVIALLVVYQV